VDMSWLPWTVYGCAVLLCGRVWWMMLFESVQRASRWFIVVLCLNSAATLAELWPAASDTGAAFSYATIALIPLATGGSLVGLYDTMRS